MLVQRKDKGRRPVQIKMKWKWDWHIERSQDRRTFPRIVRENNGIRPRSKPENQELERAGCFTFVVTGPKPWNRKPVQWTLISQYSPNPTTSGRLLSSRVYLSLPSQMNKQHTVSCERSTLHNRPYVVHLGVLISPNFLTALYLRHRRHTVPLDVWNGQQRPSGYTHSPTLNTSTGVRPSQLLCFYDVDYIDDGP